MSANTEAPVWLLLDDEDDPGTSDWRLVFADEFNGAGVSSANWVVLNESGYGAGNDPGVLKTSHCYMASEVNVSGGRLLLTARPQVNTCNSVFSGKSTQMLHTSGAIWSKGKQSWKYGRFEIRARFSTGKGIWPAIWLKAEDHPHGGGGLTVFNG